MIRHALTLELHQGLWPLLQGGNLERLTVPRRYIQAQARIHLGRNISENSVTKLSLSDKYRLFIRVPLQRIMEGQPFCFPGFIHQLGARMASEQKGVRLGHDMMIPIARPAT